MHGTLHLNRQQASGELEGQVRREAGEVKVMVGMCHRSG